ncbi:hypothetical protein PGT21_014192 [Puccinia graminis f. sp. tritici]|uniref:Uncharacterized protein n=1 Tax=Puccinia graminis f. sp. tritici TaxID=56615 RepID=A0A5B0NRL5_PUCGR|nr:hypothetical protein PGTUg99_013432 [Puccinia graminis f. sp. tritici]KAA1090800.1 hypothetical protein PGT21_014192 [Puccinia graminis f. sp. tritici]
MRAVSWLMPIRAAALGPSARPHAKSHNFNSRPVALGHSGRPTPGAGNGSWPEEATSAWRHSY